MLYRRIYATEKFQEGQETGKRIISVKRGSHTSARTKQGSHSFTYFLSMCKDVRRKVFVSVFLMGDDMADQAGQVPTEADTQIRT